MWKILQVIKWHSVKGFNWGGENIKEYGNGTYNWTKP